MIAELVEASTKAGGGVGAFEAAHRSVSSFDPAMVLFDPIVQILVGSVFHAFVQLSPDRAWITVMPNRGDTRGMMPVTILAGRKNAFAASISRVSLNYSATMRMSDRSR